MGPRRCLTDEAPGSSSARLLARPGSREPEVHEDGRLGHLRVVPDLLGGFPGGEGAPARGDPR